MPCATHPTNWSERQDAGRDRAGHRFEVVERLRAHDVAHDGVEGPIVEDGVRVRRTPDGEVDLERLGDLALVRQDPHAYVEAHAGELDLEAVGHGGHAQATLVMRRVSSCR